MFAQRKMPEFKLDEVSRQTTRLINQLLRESTTSGLKLRAMGNLRKLLQCMALGTHQYDVAIVRVNNAQRYLECGEPGAAKFEVRMLSSGLQPNIVEGEGPALENRPGTKRPLILAAVKPVSTVITAQTRD